MSTATFLRVGSIPLPRPLPLIRFAHLPPCPRAWPRPFRVWMNTGMGAGVAISFWVTLRVSVPAQRTPPTAKKPPHTTAKGLRPRCVHTALCWCQRHPPSATATRRRPGTVFWTKVCTCEATGSGIVHKGQACPVFYRGGRAGCRSRGWWNATHCGLHTHPSMLLARIICCCCHMCACIAVMTSWPSMAMPYRQVVSTTAPTQHRMLDQGHELRNDQHTGGQ